MTTVYLSSTFRDLEHHRKAVFDALRRSGRQVIAMEDYVAQDERPAAKCLDDIAKCDAYVGIFGFRYGYVPPPAHNPEGRSITELEYREASRLGKQRFIFLVDDRAEWPASALDHRDEADRGARIDALRKELGTEHMASFFRTKDELASLVQSALSRWEREREGGTPTPPEGERTVVHPREVTTDICVLHLEQDKANLDLLVRRFVGYGRKVHLASGLLFGDDQLELAEREARASLVTLLALTNSATSRLEERPAEARAVIDVFRARSAATVAVCQDERGLRCAESLGISMAYAGWNPGKLPPQALLEAVEAAISRLRRTSQTRVLGLPCVVVTMSAAEALQLLESRPPGSASADSSEDRQQGLLEVLRQQGLPALLQRYGHSRQEWRPFGPGTASIRDILANMAQLLNRTADRRLQGRWMALQDYPFDPLVNPPSEPRVAGALAKIYAELVSAACVVVVDELSLLHPRLREAFVRWAQPGLDRMSLVTVTPLDPYAAPAYRFAEDQIKECLAAATTRFDLDFDPLCEISIGDERRLSRWLHHSLPDALAALRDPRPNPQALSAFVRHTGLQPDPEMGSRLFSEGGGL
jgi:hypothetical protein